MRSHVRPDFNPPPLDAQALSGGKITHWEPTPYLPSDPSAKTFLRACRQISVDSRQARSAFVIIQTGKFGRFPLHALVVGNKTLVLPEDLVTMGMGDGAITDTTFVFYDRSPTAISLIVDSPWALVGKTRIPLSMPMVQVPETREYVMALPDLLKVFAERDRQRHQSPFIHYMKTIYDLRDE